MNFCYYYSPLGRMLLTEEDAALTGAYFSGQRHYPLLPPEAKEADTLLLAEAKAWLCTYFAGEVPAWPSFSLRPRGSDFQQKVWEALLHIPYGAARTYGDLAAELGSSPRAVGSAVGHNPISLLIPCHRVVGVKGRLTGYAGGVERKQYLLTLESNKS